MYTYIYPATSASKLTRERYSRIICNGLTRTPPLTCNLFVPCSATSPSPGSATGGSWSGSGDESPSATLARALSSTPGEGDSGNVSPFLGFERSQFTHNGSLGAAGHL